MPRTCKRGQRLSLLSKRRYYTEEDDYGRFTVTDNQNSTSTRLYFDFRGQANARTATTWDFAPIDEEAEVETHVFNEFRRRIHNDDTFIERQLKWNRRHDLWHQQMQTEGTATTQHSLWTATGQATDIDGTSFWMTSDVGRYGFRGAIPDCLKDHPRLLNFYHNYSKQITKLVKSWKWLLPNPTAKEHQKRLAERKSTKLLKSWLEPHEFNELMKRGELEIFTEDAVYVVKKNPHSMVEKKTKKGKKSEFCLITKEMGYASGDVLLTKIIMLKTNPKQFESIANGYHTR